MKLRLIKMKSVKSTNDTAIRLIKKNQFKPTLVNPGDDVEFYEVDLKEYNNLNE